MGENDFASEAQTQPKPVWRLAAVEGSSEKALKNSGLVRRCDPRARVADREFDFLPEHQAETDGTPSFVVGNGILDQIQQRRAKQRTISPHFNPILDFHMELDIGISGQDLRIFDNGFEVLA